MSGRKNCLDYWFIWEPSLNHWLVYTGLNLSSALRLLDELFLLCRQKSTLGKLASQWQQRWVTLDSEALTYYSTNKVRQHAMSPGVESYLTLSVVKENLPVA
jgi:hypothetical protein